MVVSHGKLVALTCYDYPTALSLDASTVDLVLVGDSLVTNVLGYKDVSEVTITDMLHHVKAVRRGLKRALLVADMPYKTYQTADSAIANAKQLIEAGADLVKLEGAEDLIEIIRVLKSNNIRTVAHIRHTPPSQTGPRKVFGSLAIEIEQLVLIAESLQSVGSEAIVLECVPERVATIISNQLDIPTIGIGSGAGCDGHIFVVTDLLGWHHPNFRFSAAFDDFRGRATIVANRFADEVRSGSFPTSQQVFKIKDSELNSALESLQNRPSRSPEQSAVHVFLPLSHSTDGAF